MRSDYYVPQNGENELVPKEVWSGSFVIALRAFLNGAEASEDGAAIHVPNRKLSLRHELVLWEGTSRDGACRRGSIGTSSCRGFG